MAKMEVFCKKKFIIFILFITRIQYYVILKFKKKKISLSLLWNLKFAILSFEKGENSLLSLEKEIMMKGNSL